MMNLCGKGGGGPHGMESLCPSGPHGMDTRSLFSGESALTKADPYRHTAFVRPIADDAVGHAVLPPHSYSPSSPRSTAPTIGCPYDSSSRASCRYCGQAFRDDQCHNHPIWGHLDAMCTSCAKTLPRCLFCDRKCVHFQDELGRTHECRYNRAASTSPARVTKANTDGSKVRCSYQQSATTGGALLCGRCVESRPVLTSAQAAAAARVAVQFVTGMIRSSIAGAAAGIGDASEGAPTAREAKASARLLDDDDGEVDFRELLQNAAYSPRKYVRAELLDGEVVEVETPTLPIVSPRPVGAAGAGQAQQSELETTSTRPQLMSAFTRVNEMMERIGSNLKRLSTIPVVAEASLSTDDNLRHDAECFRSSNGRHSRDLQCYDLDRMHKLAQTEMVVSSKMIKCAERRQLKGGGVLRRTAGAGANERYVKRIAVIRGLPRSLFVAHLCHEYIHALLFLSEAPPLPRDVEEGLCNVVAEIYLSVRVEELRLKRHSAREGARASARQLQQGTQRRCARGPLPPDDVKREKDLRRQRCRAGRLQRELDLCHFQIKQFHTETSAVYGSKFREVTREYFSAPPSVVAGGKGGGGRERGTKEDKKSLFRVALSWALRYRLPAAP
eukprot:GHVU01158684.1.p1 GENE.GHVU01158684.1~~GHVU01158684.1.p1  ORF type:complete len:614 (+),score=70.55 GHVU01158684.1:129-1970(+)